MKKKLFSAVILSCCLLFAGCNEESSAISNSPVDDSTIATSVSSNSNTDEISSQDTETSIEVSEEISSIPEENSSSTEATESVTIGPDLFNFNYGDEIMDLAGYEFNVLNVKSGEKSGYPVIQFSSGKKRDAGCLTTTKAYSGIRNISISQLETGYDGFVSFFTSDDGETFTEIEDIETESAYEYSFNIEDSKYIKIVNGSNDYAMYLNSIVLTVSNG